MKIFGIGLSKTGTTSLAAALGILGYKTKDNPGIDHYAPGDLATSIDEALLAEYDAFTDTPIPCFYRELDERFPGSRFILTTREMEGWLNSCRKQFTQKLADKQNAAHNHLFLDLYGCTVYNEKMFREGYEKFTRGVKDYFRDRPHDLLVMDVAGGDGWKDLCSFLNEPVPDIPFPKANVTRIRWMKIEDVVAVAREAGTQARNFHRRAIGGADDNRLRRLIDSIAYGIAGNDPLQKAVRASNRIITEKLKMLNPQIPIISRTDESLRQNTKEMPSHFWLVDPLDGEAGFINTSGSFTIDIALIEDRRPILGVVYAPVIDTMYYSMEGKGGYRIDNGGTAVALSPSGTDRWHDDGEHTVASTALTICLAAEGRIRLREPLSGSMEWETACAQAVLKAIAIKIMDGSTLEELAYSKKNFINGPLTLD